MEISNEFCKINLKEDYETSTEIENEFDLDLEQVLKKIAIKEGLPQYDVERTLVSNPGGNYMGTLYEVDIKSKMMDKEKVISLFLKRIKMGVDAKIISITDAYAREFFIYSELSNIYLQFQIEARIPKEQIFEFVKSYGVLKKPSSETLILENIAKRGYTTYDRMKSVCNKFAELAIADLAKFHALGYVLQSKRKPFFNANYDTFKHSFNMNDSWITFIKTVSKITLKKLDCPVKKRKLEQFVEHKLLKEYSSYLGCTRNSTICHGDFRANNIMIQLENGVDSNIKKVMVVDYQLTNYGCPLNDFFYFIFVATDQEFRKNHLADLKTLYYKTLTEFLKYFDINVEDVYPKDVFEEEYKTRMDFGLMMAVTILPFVLAEGSDIPELTADGMKDINISDDNDEIFKKRILEVVDDFIDWGYL